MTNPDQPAEPEQPDATYPEQWGYQRAATGAVAAAVDVYASSMTDDEFNQFVARVRPKASR